MKICNVTNINFDEHCRIKDFEVQENNEMQGLSNAFTGCHLINNIKSNNYDKEELYKKFNLNMEEK